MRCERVRTEISLASTTNKTEQKSAYERFLAEIYIDTMKTAVAIYLVLQTPKDVDPAEFVNFLQENYEEFERKKERLAESFCEYKASCELPTNFINEVVPVVGSESTGIVNANSWNSLKMYRFQLEMMKNMDFSQRVGRTDVIFRKLLAIGDMEMSEFSGERMNGKNATNTQMIHEFSNDLKQGFSSWAKLELQGGCVSTKDLSNYLLLITNYVLKTAEHGKDSNVYWFDVLTHVLEALASALGEVKSQEHRRLLAEFVHTLARGVLEQTAITLSDIHELSARDRLCVFSKTGSNLWLLLRFLKRFSSPILNDDISKDLCSQLNSISTTLQMDKIEGTEIMNMQNAGSLYLLFLLRNSVMKLRERR